MHAGDVVPHSTAREVELVMIVNDGRLGNPPSVDYTGAVGLQISGFTCVLVSPSILPVHTIITLGLFVFAVGRGI